MAPSRAERVGERSSPNSVTSHCSCSIRRGIDGTAGQVWPGIRSQLPRSGTPRSQVLALVLLNQTGLGRSTIYLTDPFPDEKRGQTTSFLTDHPVCARFGG